MKQCKKERNECRSRFLLTVAFLLCALIFANTTTVNAAVSQDGQYTYELDAAGQAVLTSYLGQDTEVAVPATMDGISVSALSGTYQNHNKITKVKIPRHHISK